MESFRRVVVTGLGVISPVGNDVDTCWKNLKNGVNGIDVNTRFDTTDFKAKLAAEVKDFDAHAYMEKQEILKSDLYEQYAVAAAEQAVRESGIVGMVDEERLSVYFGSGIGGIDTMVAQTNRFQERGPSRVSPHLIPMLIPNMGAGMIAIRYQAKGPCLPAVTACASGSNAIGEGVRLIRHGYADAVISGGAEAAINAVGMAGFINMKALSISEDRNAASVPFDRRHAGFVMGEGAAALVLEEYEHAKQRGAKIYGEIAGYGATCDAYHITSPLPDASGGSRAIRLALEEAGYTPAEKVYVNAHGTGTPLNDIGETRAIKDAFGEEKAHEVLVSSTKSMTAHMLGAAGAMEALICLKVLEEGVVPPTINLLEPDPACDLNYVPGQAVQAHIDLCISNSMGFGGHNATLAFRRI